MQRIFTATGDFEAFRDAQAVVQNCGYTCGSPQRGQPIGIAKGTPDTVYISKWLNMTRAERKSLDGVMTGDIRTGPVTVQIYEAGDKRIV